MNQRKKQPFFYFFFCLTSFFFVFIVLFRLDLIDGENWNTGGMIEYLFTIAITLPNPESTVYRSTVL